MSFVVKPFRILGLGFAFVLLAVLTRLGLVALASFIVVWETVAASPPLNFSQWYAGRAVIALLVPLAVLAWEFYASLGGQPMFGSALKEE